MRCKKTSRFMRAASRSSLLLAMTSMGLSAGMSYAQVLDPAENTVQLAAASDPITTVAAAASAAPTSPDPVTRQRPDARPPEPTGGALASLAMETSEACRARLDRGDADATTTPLSVPLMFRARYVGDISIDVDMDGKGQIDSTRVQELLSPLLSRSASDALNVIIGKNEKTDFSTFCNGPVRFEFDMGLLQVNADALVDYLGTQPIGFGRANLPDPTSFDEAEGISAGIGVTLDQGFNFLDNGEAVEDLKGLIEGYTNIGGFNGATVFFGANFDAGRNDVWRRREVLLTKDFFDNATRLTAGEVIAPLTSFQSAPPLLGISFSREFRAIQPFNRTITTGRGEVLLDRPSRVDVFTNGILTETLDLEPGRYTLSDFPTSQGANEVELVIRDDFGRVETQTLNFFSSSELLAKGLFDFGITAGVPRSPTTTGFEYGDEAFATGFINYGFNDQITLGANAQANETRQQVGLELITGTRLGTFSFEAVASNAQADGLLLDDVSGAAAGFNHRAQFTLGQVPIQTSLSVLSRSEDFTGLSGGLRENHGLQLQATARASLTETLVLNTTYGRLDARRGQADTDRLSVNISRSFEKFALSLNTNYVQRSGEPSETNLLVSLSVPFGQRANLRTSYDTRENTRQLEVSRTNARQIDEVGARLRLTEDDTRHRVDARGEYINNRFESALEYTGVSAHSGSGERRRSRADLQVSSFIGFAGGRFAVGRPSPDGFVIASPHSSLKANKVEIMNQSGSRIEGRAGLFGNALLPIQRSYLPQGFAAKVHDLPLGYNIGSGQIHVLPAPGAGYVLSVGSDANRSVLGTLIMADGTPVAGKVGEFYPLGDPGASLPFFTNRTGRFALDQLAPGTYVLAFEDDSNVEFTITPDAEGLVNVGKITLP